MAADSVNRPMNGWIDGAFQAYWKPRRKNFKTRRKLQYSNVVSVFSVYNNYYIKKEFLSWQTWDLYYGFKNLRADFTSANPVYLNGSAIETFFSQVKAN